MLQKSRQPSQRWGLHTLLAHTCQVLGRFDVLATESISGAVPSETEALSAPASWPAPRQTLNKVFTIS